MTGIYLLSYSYLSVGVTASPFGFWFGSLVWFFDLVLWFVINLTCGKLTPDFFNDDE